jgi:hypothetical protein
VPRSPGTESPELDAQLAWRSAAPRGNERVRLAPGSTFSVPGVPSVLGAYGVMFTDRLPRPKIQSPAFCYSFPYSDSQPHSDPSSDSDAGPDPSAGSDHSLFA